jgi:CDP-diacylglycerol--glycerol-3-phosphate 3-phosphatidyltransferase/cardiolipin synthase
VTTANKITLFRILLVPVFIVCGVYYGQSVAEGMPDQRLRWAAITLFAIASLSDALDGYIARNYNQQTRLGVILDPLADKFLMLGALLTLSFTSWPQKFPLWFPIVLISRDVISVAAAFVIDRAAGHCEIKAHWTGKVATVSQMVAILWVMLDLRFLPALWAAVVAGAFTIISGVINLIDGIKQLQNTGHAHPKP